MTQDDTTALCMYGIGSALKRISGNIISKARVQKLGPIQVTSV